MADQTIVPPQRPRSSRAWVERTLEAAGYAGLGPVLLGRRGYYRDVMGAEGKNDRALYDDAIFLVGPGAFDAWNANTDPTDPDTGTKLGTLALGTWPFRLGEHHPGTPRAYACLVQDAQVELRRDNGVVSIGWLGVQIHKGGYYTTGSAGCQTIYPDQWGSFIGAVLGAMRRAGVQRIPYVLTEWADVPAAPAGAP